MNKLRSPAIDKYTTRNNVIYGRGSVSVTDARFDGIKNDYENLSQYLNSKNAINFGRRDSRKPLF